MSRQISVKPYRRAFRQPLRTAHGEWATREGFLVRVEQEGRVGYGEVAPLPEFGSETLAEATAFLEQLVSQTRDRCASEPTLLCICPLGGSSCYGERKFSTLWKMEGA